MTVRNEMKVIKDQLNEAFKSLRKAGYLAKQWQKSDYYSTWGEKKVSTRREQYNEFYGTLYVDFEYENVNGAEVVKVLKEHGLNVQWKMSEFSAIEIIVPAFEKDKKTPVQTWKGL